MNILDKLDDDVLLHIFNFLPNDDIIVASEVCERWHLIISSSEVLMRSLVLKIDDKATGLEDENSLFLPYRNIEIFFAANSKKEEAVKRFLTDYSGCIETMILTAGNDYMMSFLPMMTNLTELTLFKYYTRNGDFKVDFPNLKSLILLDASSFIDHIRSHKIETLKVREEPSNYYENNDWGKFFGTCEMLKHLTLIQFVEIINLSDYSFKLSSLMVSGVSYDEEYFIDFISKIYALIRAQKDSLKKVSLQGLLMSADPDIFNFMIYDMKLEELSCQVDPMLCFNYVKPKENSTIKKLQLIVANGFSQNLLDVLKSLHAVEDFDFNFHFRSNCEEIFRVLHYRMPKLKTLSIRNPAFVNFPPNVLIENDELKVKQVGTLIFIDSFQSRGSLRKIFLTCAPNIKKLIMKGELYDKFDNLSSEEFKKILKSLAQLEEFELRGTIEVDDEVLELISHSKLRRITIVYRSSDLDQVNEVCDKLNAAHARLVVIKRA